ncbi:hypothetical protein I5Q34_32620 [Streptomyces sp. AV19]|uniref:hypothetical protein n=1 Tax=Streptomyces sp. AV19 TaxID=2793068 RepID=UPI0018FE3C76|nr:hypothetical protein [Streptomyces sp. AV19]MBH1938951.1 hypothetical protein [Streptomyces sp. AV19]MDG4531639.1 hypothetical protein [Streptomyces sp. AV19]
MVQATRKLAVGFTLALSLTACTMGGERGAIPESSAEQLIPLGRLKSIDLSGDLPAAEEFPESKPPKAVGELRKGPRRLIAYTQEGSCGLLVADAANSKQSLIDITSAWPKNDSEGSKRYPAGPYSFTSGAGSSESETWASLYCSKAAMVIEYSSKEHAPASDQKGSVSTKAHQGDSDSLTVVIGSPEVRKTILRQA